MTHGRRMRERPASDRGATAAEYAVILGLIAAVIIVSVAILGFSVFGLFATTEDTLASATGPETVSVPLAGTIEEQTPAEEEQDPSADSCPNLAGLQPAGFDCSLPVTVAALTIGKGGGKAKYTCADSINYQLVRGQKVERNKTCILKTVAAA